MSELVKILTLNNQIETIIIEKVLKEKNIPYILKSFHDSAYDGIFQMQYGWGIILAQEKYRNEIMEIYDDIIKKK